ncbi:MAG: GmrSD restriction endonuclease domain-containing protein [Gulosibacter sp.]|uniref:GmrSD restriction endonuclease domain-containing protein n=1 Tax=Gulosibacter sp. TaxID=2817531 RepID=UPI003F8FB9F5
MALKAQEHELLTVFSGFRRYYIPNFQREYSWGVSEAIQLAEDLLDAWKRNDSSYFLGSVVLVRNGDNEQFDVIDGQQRLTTLALMFSVIRHLSGDSAVSDEITSLLTVERNLMRGIQASPRVLLREVDQPFMNTFVESEDLINLLDLTADQAETAGQRNILENVRAFIRYFSDETTETERWEFLQYINRHAFVVTVETDDYESAHRIFGVMNTRGMPLTASDIFKSRVIGGLPNDLRNSNARRWEEAMENAGTDPDEFFRELLVLSTKSLGKRSLISEFPEQVLAKEYAGIGGVRFIEDVLVPFSAVYRYVQGSASHPNAEVDRWLRRLQQFPGEEWRTVAMWALRTVHDETELVELLRSLERLTGVSVTAGLTRQPREQQVVNLLRKCEDAAAAGRPLDHRELVVIDDQIRKRAIQALKGELNKGELRKVWLTRAYAQETGQFIDTRRGLGVMSLLPTSAHQRTAWGIDSAVAEHWQSRLGAMAITRERRRRTPEGMEFAAFSKSLRAAPGDQESVVNTVNWPHDRWEAQVLQARQDALVALIADFWEIRHDLEGIDLTRLSEAQLLTSSGGLGELRSRRILLKDIIDVGLVHVGDQFVWVRKKLGETHRMTVAADHRFELADGRRVDSPSAATAAVSGRHGNAFDSWVRESDSKTLRDIWDVYRRRL